MPLASSTDARLRSASMRFRSLPTSRCRSEAIWLISSLRVWCIDTMAAVPASCSRMRLVSDSMIEASSSSRRRSAAVRSFWMRMKSSSWVASAFSRDAIVSPIFDNRSRLAPSVPSRVAIKVSRSMSPESFEFASESLVPTSCWSALALSRIELICPSDSWRVFCHSLRRLSSAASFS